MEFKRLFTPITIQGMELRNRIVLLPMSTGFIELDESVGEHFHQLLCLEGKGRSRSPYHSLYSDERQHAR